MRIEPLSKNKRKEHYLQILRENPSLESPIVSAAEGFVCKSRRIIAQPIGSSR